MAINEISYANKSDINTSSVPITNKITSSDINEVKTVVNANANLMGDLTNLNTTDKSSLVNAINETIDNMEWTFLGSAMGTNTITLPNTFREILCITKSNSGDSTNFTIVIPYDYLTSNPLGFNDGYYATEQGNAYCRVLATKTSAYLSASFLNGSNVLNNTELTIYYR